MTKVLAKVSEPHNDPVVSIVDLDETKGMVPIGALNGVVRVEMVFLSNEQARLIRKAMDGGARGAELDAAIVTILAPGEPGSPENPLPPDQLPGVTSHSPAPMEPSPEQGNPAPPAGDGNT